MFIYDEMEFETLEPVCSCCGTYLTFDEWQNNGDLCDYCSMSDSDYEE